jgi:hypothetical protein
MQRRQTLLATVVALRQVGAITGAGHGEEAGAKEIEEETGAKEIDQEDRDISSSVTQTQAYPRPLRRGSRTPNYRAPIRWRLSPGARKRRACDAADEGDGRRDDRGCEGTRWCAHRAPESCLSRRTSKGANYRQIVPDNSRIKSLYDEPQRQRQLSQAQRREQREDHRVPEERHR